MDRSTKLLYNYCDLCGVIICTPLVVKQAAFIESLLFTHHVPARAVFPLVFHKISSIPRYLASIHGR